MRLKTKIIYYDVTEKDVITIYNKDLIIKESHKRSESYGVSRNGVFYKKFANEQKLNEILRKNEKLLNVAIPYINIFQYSIGNEDFIFILTDENGCILYINGDENLLNEFEKRNLILGAYMDEESIGTNAMGTAIKEDKSIQITATEHYITAFQTLTCLASPIHDKDGNIIGTLNLTGSHDKKNYQNLGAVKFCVNIIENEMRREEVKNKKYEALTQVKEKNTGASYTFENIIGSSESTKNVINKCKIIANSPSTVLIEGESGTGKEILAQSIHNYSYRRNNRFVAINCGAIPENIIESELFGYEDGAFTGGRKGGKSGKFEAANGGTLFLDEVGDMPLNMQVKLLRVLQEGRITRVGGYKEIPIDVRIIAATNKKLKKEIEKGTFREDLYYRLCVIPINVPPLRQRKKDIEDLIQYFLKSKSDKLGKSLPSIDGNMLKRFVDYEWPGNIRELENSIEGYVNLDDDFNFNIRSYSETEEAVDDVKDVKDDCEKNVTLYTLEHMERIMIEKAIYFSSGNMTKAAKSLGVSRNTLYLKVKKYGIDMS